MGEVGQQGWRDGPERGNSMHGGPQGHCDGERVGGAASTGVKDPEYDDSRYVVELVAPGTVNTAPEKPSRRSPITEWSAATRSSAATTKRDKCLPN